jgi:hypothetical protein
MADVRVEITVRPLSAWTEEELRRLYRLSLAHVRQLAERPDDDAERVEQLADAQDRAALYGEELLRRGLL